MVRIVETLGASNPRSHQHSNGLRRKVTRPLNQASLTQRLIGGEHGHVQSAVSLPDSDPVQSRLEPCILNLASYLASEESRIKPANGRRL
jgi:hypothetical protein